jgi:hypothetical protein
MTPDPSQPDLTCNVCGSAAANTTVCGHCAELVRSHMETRPSSIPLPAEVGPCSFCALPPGEVAALFLGPAFFGQTARLCDQCLDLCCDIIAEKRAAEPWLRPKHLAQCPGCRQERPESSMLPCCTSCYARARAPADVPPPKQLTVLPAPAPSLPQPPGAELACSFCHRPRSLVRDLICGPRVFVCDLCVTEFALELEPRYWWIWERPQRP